MSVDIKTSVEYCPICDIPPCYCRFFNLHKEETPATENTPEAPAKPVQKEKNVERPKIQIVVKSRSKRKFTTTIKGIEPWLIDPKELTRAISKKLAIGCSAQKKNGLNQVVIQGDSGSQVVEILKSQFAIPANGMMCTRKQKKPEPEAGSDGEM